MPSILIQDAIGFPIRGPLVVDDNIVTANTTSAAIVRESHNRNGEIRIRNNLLYSNNTDQVVEYIDDTTNTRLTTEEANSQLEEFENNRHIDPRLDKVYIPRFGTPSIGIGSKPMPNQDYYISFRARIENGFHIGQMWPEPGMYN